MKASQIKIEWRVFSLSILLGVIVWVLDCFVDAYFFSMGSLGDQIFHPENFELYMRGIILLIFTGYGLVVSKVISRLRDSEEEKSRTIVQLQNAQKKLKILRGILPICASCKKIRDEEGSWQQNELYFGTHSEVEFSHGICPDCLKKAWTNIQ